MAEDRADRPAPPVIPSAARNLPGPGDGHHPSLDRRRFLALGSLAGVAGTALPGLLWAAAEEGRPITAEVLAAAEKIAGLEFTPAERELMLEDLAELRTSYEAIRRVSIPNGVPPAYHFDPRLPGEDFGGGTAAASPVAAAQAADPAAAPVAAAAPAYPTPEAAEELTFAPVTELSRLLRSGEVSSLTLTRMYLDRLRRYDPHLHCVVTLTEERALDQARRADRELGEGRPRGPLHGVPWGAKDLFSVGGYPTTWGATPYRDQVIDADATVVRRLDEAGAVLVAKLTLGALAWGDVWFGGRTRNPWKLGQGSSGSSAGSASATAAGLVGFALGTETWGSIVSPASRVGATGLRPTFGRVSRSGAMALSWTMDKVGPICRAVEDCALVLQAIHGPDGEDPTVIDAPFDWDPTLDPTGLRVGWVRDLFEGEPEDEDEAAWRERDLAALATLRGMGVRLVPMSLPTDLPIESLSFVLSAEAAAAFDELTRSNRDDLLVRQIRNAWPNTFRQARTIPAVEYIQANRVRTMLMRRMAEAMAGLDAYVVPSFGGTNLLMTNLTGHPAVVVPHGFRDDGTPTSITFQGERFGEAKLLALAKSFQFATNFHLRHPDLDAKIREFEEAGGDAALEESSG